MTESALPVSIASRPTSASLLRRVGGEFLRPYWQAILLVVLCTLMIGVTAALYPTVIKWTFDALQARDLDILFWAPLAVIAATLLKGLASFAQVLITNRTVTRIEVAMQDKLFRHLMDADMLLLMGDNSGDLVQRFNSDVARIRSAIATLVTVVFRDIATAIGVIAWMIYADWQLSLVLFVVLALAIWPINWVGKKIRQLSHALASASGSNTSAIVEALETPRLAKLFQLESYLKERASARFEQIRRYHVRAANFQSLTQPAMEVAGGVAIAGVLTIVSWRIVAGATSIGEFIAFITALVIAAQPLAAIGNFSVLIQDALASIERYYLLLDRQPSVTERADAMPLKLGSGSIRFENVGFSYRSGEATLTDLSFEVEGGKVTALVGRSGSGKTTVFGLLPRLFDVTHGRILIDGQDIRSLTFQSLRSSMAFVSQDAVLYDDTIERNIGFGKPGASLDEIRAAAKAAAVSAFIEQLPEGYQTQVGTRGERLSGGQRQRIAIARAFLKNAPILCLDEATSALDSQSEAEVQEAMGRLMVGRTVLIIAHRLSTIRDAQRIIVLEHGRVAEVGSHQALLAQSGIYASLHQLQVTRPGALS